VVLEPLAGRNAADDLDGLARGRQRRREPHAVPALHDLGPAGAEPEQEATVRQRLERHRGHGQVGRRARPDLRDARPEPDPARPGGEEGQRCERVLAPRFRHPDGVRPEPLGLDDEVDVRGREHHRCNADPHGPAL
jgi:hypothetical protein